MSMKATRDAYGEWLVETGKTNRDIVVVDADLAESTKTILFAKAYPERFFDVGTAEQNLVDIAAGLAIGGKRAFASSFAYFLTGRAWDQIRNIVAHDNLNVCLVASHGGFSAASDGASHLAFQDIALMRVIPNMRVVVPVDAEETKSILDAALKMGGPFYIRLRRDKEPILQKPYNLKLGKAETMKDGSDLTFVSCGPMVEATLRAATLLRERGVDAKVLNIHTIKPIDGDALVLAAKATGSVITVEDHSIYGGLGGSVAEVLSENYPVQVYRLGVPDVYGGSSRSADTFLKEFGLTPDQLAAYAERVIQKRRN
jgi:transketolase